MSHMLKHLSETGPARAWAHGFCSSCPTRRLNSIQRKHSRPQIQSAFAISMPPISSAEPEVDFALPPAAGQRHCDGLGCRALRLSGWQVICPSAKEDIRSSPWRHRAHSELVCFRMFGCGFEGFASLYFACGRRRSSADVDEQSSSKWLG